MTHETRRTRATSWRMKAGRRVPAFASPERRSTRSSNASRVAVGMAGLVLLVGSGVVSAPPQPAAATTAITQLGAAIDGEAMNDQSGWSVSLSANGSRVAIGAPTNRGRFLPGDDSGHVRVYDWDEAVAAWTQVGNDIDGEAAGDMSGRSVSLSADGSRVAIGAPSNDGAGAPGNGAGHVRVYDWNGTAWTQVGGDIDGEEGDGSGWSVSLSADGSRVAVGARSSDAAGSDAGRVRVYDWDGTAAAWTQVGGAIDGEAVGDQSGSSVSLSADGSRVAVGAPYNDGAANNAGRVRVYAWDGTAWTQVGGDIDGEAADDRSGTNVSLSADGSRLAVGAPDNGDAGEWAGHMRVYDWDGTAWTQVGDDIDGEGDFDSLGRSVSLSADGSRVAVGALSSELVSAGRVLVFALPTRPLGVPPVPGAGPVPPSLASSLACGPLPVTVGATVTCTVTGGDPGIDILWRAAYDPVVVEEGLTLDASGTGEFAFGVPAAALGAELTVELVEWLAPLSLGTVSGPVPTSVPSGEGPVPAWWLGMFVLAGGLALRRMSRIGGHA